MRTSCPDPKRSGTAHAVTSPGKLRSKSSPAKTKALPANLIKASGTNPGTITPKRIVIGSSNNNNPFGHVLTQEST